LVFCLLSFLASWLPPIKVSRTSSHGKVRAAPEQGPVQMTHGQESNYGGT
jgi:hypothetical protein